MKKITIISFSILMLNAAANAQNNPPVYPLRTANSIAVQETVFNKTIFSFTNDSTPVKDHDYYLTKSKNQKTAAWILLGGGIGFMAGGLLSASSKSATFDQAFTGAFFIVTGFVSSLTSIPLFMASARNKIKSILSISSQKTGFGIPANVNKSITGITVTIPIGI